MNDFTKKVVVVIAALFLLETETAAIIIASYYTIIGKSIPQSTSGFIGFGLTYAAAVLGIQYGIPAIKGTQQSKSPSPSDEKS